jgi:hypothetical protein
MTQINKGRLFVRQRPSDDELAGVIRRGIAEIDSSRPRESITTRKPRAGSNPYECGTTGRFRHHHRRHHQTADQLAKDSGDAFNPYDTAAGLQTGRSWDDMEFDTLEFDNE